MEVTRGPDKKLRRDLDADHVVVGSHETCDLQLSDPTVSRQHFEIALVPRGYRIRDLDSLNGMTIDGMRVFDVIVDRPTTIEVGSTRIKLAPTSDSVELALSTETRCGPLLGRSARMRRVVRNPAQGVPHPDDRSAHRRVGDGQGGGGAGRP